VEVCDAARRFASCVDEMESQLLGQHSAVPRLDETIPR
jgi:hypothetical protein